jgi:hypothetical protein
MGTMLPPSGRNWQLIYPNRIVDLGLGSTPKSSHLNMGEMEENQLSTEC